MASNCADFTRRAGGVFIRQVGGVGGHLSHLVAAPRGAVSCRWGPFGRPGTSQTYRGYLYDAIWSLVNARSSAGVAVRTRLERHGGTDLLAELVVRDTDHGSLGDRRVLIQDFLNLARIDVEPAADDHVLLPVDNVEVAILVDSAEVTGAEPAAGDRRSRRLRLTPVPLHDVVTGDHDLADLAGLQFGAVGIRPRASRTPAIGVPTKPGLRTLSGWLNDATGEVSDSP